MKFKNFAETADEVSNESSNNTKRDKIATLLVEADEKALHIVPRFIQGEVFPADSERKTGVGPSLMRSVVSEATGVDEDTIKEMLLNVSDMGEVFDKLDITSSSPSDNEQVNVADVAHMLDKVASCSGAGSQQEKIDLLVGTISNCSGVEAKYITRLVLKEMRIGVGGGTVRKAIAKAFDVGEDAVERAIMLSNDVGSVAQTAKKEGNYGLKNIEVNVLESPIKPMLAKKTQVDEALEDIESDTVMVQYKYDGARLQIHVDDGEVRLFTRQLEDITDSMPDVVERVRENMKIDKAIIDAEVVGYSDEDSTEPLPFQEVLKRLRRKHDIEEKSDEIALDIHVFDLLYAENTGSVIDNPLASRWAKLDSVVTDEVQSEHEDVSSALEVRRISQKAQNDGHEGVMVKDPYATYEPNKRGKNWLKIKPEGETIDAVVTGGTYGDGKRSDFISSFELAVRDTDTDELKSIGDVGTGFTDDEFEVLTEKFEDLIMTQDGQDLTFNNKVVFEVLFEEVQPSPEYDSGYGLRFPRFIQVRQDKSPRTADTLSRLENIGGFD